MSRAALEALHDIIASIEDPKTSKALLKWENQWVRTATADYSFTIELETLYPGVVEEEKPRLKRALSDLVTKDINLSRTFGSPSGTRFITGSISVLREFPEMSDRYFRCHACGGSSRSRYGGPCFACSGRGYFENEATTNI